jgi:MFS family permease
MALLGISAAVFAFVVPGLSDKLGRKPVVVVFSLIGVLYPLAVLNYTGSPVLLGAIIFIGWSASGVFPIFMATIPSETIPVKYVATSLGLIVCVGEVVGGAMGPPIAGKLADLYGLQAPNGVKNLTKIVAGKQLWNYDNLEPSEKKIVL